MSDGLHRQWLGTGDGPPIVLLHEGLGSVSQWLRSGFPEQLASASGRRILLYDRLGYGRSADREWQLDFLRDEALVRLPALLDEEGIGQAWCYGHSDGATVALQCAAHHPERILGVVAESPHTVVEARTMQGIRDTVGRFQAEPRALEGLSRHHGDRAQALFDAWTRMWLDPAFDGCDIRTDLNLLRVPCLTLQGDADPYGSAIHAREIERRSQAAVRTRLLSGEGHSPHRNPQGWLAEVARFFA